MSSSRPHWSPLADLHRWERRQPEAAAIFYPQGGVWRWRSWGWLGGAVEWARSALAGLPTGSVVGYPYAPTPRCLAIELALQSGGWDSAPVRSGMEGDPGDVVESWIAPSPSKAPTGLPWITVGEPPGRRGPAASAFIAAGETSSGLGEGTAAHWWTLRAGCWHQVSDARLRRATADLDARLGPAPRRDIALVAGPLAAPVERAWLSWALGRGAALVLVPRRQETAVDFAWCRPTVACLDVEEADAVRGWLERETSPRRRRRWYRRFRGLLLRDGELDDAAAAFWSEMGASVIHAESLAW